MWFFFFLSLQIVEFKEKESSPCEIDCSFYLSVVKHSSIEDDPHDDSIETEIPKMYLKVLTLIEFDTFVITHGPFTSVDGMLSVLYLYIQKSDLHGLRYCPIVCIHTLT
jgi:hypothetical protein